MASWGGQSGALYLYDQQRKTAKSEIYPIYLYLSLSYRVTKTSTEHIIHSRATAQGAPKPG
eukprot:scaffold4914_cov134-Skeletonema_marinoi.AAC.14